MKKIYQDDESELSYEEEEKYMTPPATKGPATQPDWLLQIDSEKDTMLNSENSPMKIKQKSAGKKKSKQPARKWSAKRTQKKTVKKIEQK